MKGSPMRYLFGLVLLISACNGCGHGKASHVEHVSSTQCVKWQCGDDTGCVCAD